MTKAILSTEQAPQRKQKCVSQRVAVWKLPSDPNGTFYIRNVERQNEYTDKIRRC